MTTTYSILDQGIQRLATELERLGPRAPEPHASTITGLGANARTLAALAFEADETEQERPDFEVLLMELLAEIQQSTVREWSLTPDQAGVDAAKLALGEMAPTLAPQPGDLAGKRRDLLEAVRAQDPTCTLELYKGDLGAKVTETIADYPVPRVPVHGDNIDLPDGRRLNVVTVRMVGRAAIVRARVWAALPKLKPGEAEKF